MGDIDLEEFGPVTWIRELFEDATAVSMYRWVLVAWIVVVGALVVLDRLGGSLLGRSRPLVQTPPTRARAWRWGRRTPPPQYSPLPPGAIAPFARPTAASVESIPLAEPRALMAAPVDLEPAPIVPLRPGVSDAEFWPTMVDDLCPVFGFENNVRLGKGLAPERFNPVKSRVEVLERDRETGAVHWPAAPDTRRITIGRQPHGSSSSPNQDPEADADGMVDAEADPEVTADADADADALVE